MKTDVPPTDFFDFDCRQECCSQVFRQVVSCLSEHGLKDEARALARWIFESRFGFSLVQLLTDKDSYFSDEERHDLLIIVHRLLHGEPIQYILGTASFCGLDIAVGPGVLIPRPETEELVAWVTDSVCACFGDTKVHLLDVGTGSGCIALAVAKRLPEAHISALDVSEEALAQARRNASALGVQIDFFCQDILKTVGPEQRCWHVVVSNPPYICRSEAQDMERNVLDYEPHLALFVPDDDPLRFYRAIAQYASASLLPGGMLFFEINRAYAREMEQLLYGMGFEQVEVRKDAYGNDRMVKCRWQNRLMK